MGEKKLGGERETKHKLKQRGRRGTRRADPSFLSKTNEPLLSYTRREREREREGEREREREANGRMGVKMDSSSVDGSQAEWWSSLKLLLNFTTPKLVTFKDWRLGLTHKILYVGIIIYTMLLIFREQRYLQDYTPLNIVTMFSSTSRPAGYIGPYEDYDTAQASMYAGLSTSATGSYSYCGSRAYDFVYSDEFQYRNISCYFGSAREVSTKLPPAGIFFTTFQATSSTSTFMMSANLPASQCTLAGFISRSLECGVGDTVAIRGARCECTRTSNVFFAGAENVVLNIEHRYDSVPTSGALPKTRFRREDSEEDLYVIEQGHKATMPLSRLLAMGGVSLDSGYAGDWSLRGASSSPNAFPMQRLTGVAITIKASYYNHGQVPGKKVTGMGEEDDVECVMEIQPAITWTSLGDDIDYGQDALLDSHGSGRHVNRYRYGVYVNVEASGVISEFNYTVLVLAIVQGLVLLKFADIVCQLMAFYLLGNRSRLFYAFGNENVSYRREYARYAAQILVTGKIFNLLDTNDDNCINRSEILRMLKESPCTHDMPAQSLNMLGALILEQVDLARDKADKQSASLTNLFKRNNAAADRRSSRAGTSMNDLTGPVPEIGMTSTAAFRTAGTSTRRHEHSITPFELLDLLYPDRCDEEGLERCIRDMTPEQKSALLQRANTFRQ